MTDLKSQSRLILEEAGYETWLKSLDGTSAIIFEDKTIMGFVFVFVTVQKMLENWYDVETKLLTIHSQPLKKAGQKTWNVYSVFLCSDRANETELGQIRQIEDNLERTRKIASCGLVVQADIVTALLPLLPLQHKPFLKSEDLDLTLRFRKRIADIAPSAVDATLNNAVSPNDVVRILEDES